MCCTRRAEKYRTQKLSINRHLGTIAQICPAISLQLRHVSTIGKNLLSSNISPTCPHNMVNFGPLTAEILSLVWGTPGTFNGFRVLAALLHGTLVVSVSQTAALNRGRHYIYSAGRPSRWALAHISSSSFFFFFFSSPNLSGRRLDVYHTLAHGVNLECRSEMRCTRLAANTGRKKVAKNRHLGTIAQVCRAISSQIRHVSTIGKKLVKQQCLLYVS